MICRRGLASKQKRSRRHVQAGVLTQPVVNYYDAQRIQQLPLVFVNALDLRIEDRVGVNRYAGCRFEPVCELRFGLALCLAESETKVSVAGKRLEPAQLTEVCDPILANGLGDNAGERRI